MRIDVHAHIVDRDYLDRLSRKLGLSPERDGDKILLRLGGHTVAWFREPMFDAVAALHDMDALSIDMRLLSLSTPNVYPWSGTAEVDIARIINDRTADICRAYPERFRGLASLPLGNTGAALAEMKRACDGLGMVGIAIGSNIAGRPLNDPGFEPIWAELNRRRIPAFIHPMFPANTSGMDEFELPLRLGFPFDTTMAATRLIYSGVLERHPHLTFVLAHTGGALLTLFERLDNGYHLFPDCRAHISQPPSRFARRFFYDTTSFSTETLTMAHRMVGADRLLFGTDAPFIGAGADHVLRLGLSQADTASILGGNAGKLFRLTSGEATSHREEILP